jgi:hypothetical protein
MHIVHSLDELLILPTDRHVNGIWARMEVRLEIPDITEAAQLRAQRALNELQDRRGTIAGAGVMFVTLLGGVLAVMERYTSLLSWRAALELVTVLMLSFTLGYAAWLVSRAFTRWQFARRCREHHRTLARLRGRCGS